MAQATDQPVSDHYLTQSGLAIALERALARLWPQIDYRNLDKTLPGLRNDLWVLIRQAARTSASLAITDYGRARREAGVRSSFTVKPAGFPDRVQVDKALGWATKDLYDPALLAPDVKPQTVQETLDTALTKAEGAATRLVLNAGRETTVQGVQEDRRARAWARETRPDCCSFCAILATRGAVYKSEGTAGRNANERFVGEGEFKYHDHCHCTAVPVFGGYEPSAHTRQFTADYYALKRELGFTPSLNQWRQRFEGRPVDGLTTTTDVPQHAG